MAGNRGERYHRHLNISVSLVGDSLDDISSELKKKKKKLVQRGATSIRAQFHNVPVELPPPPSLPSHVSDHCY